MKVGRQAVSPENEIRRKISSRSIESIAFAQSFLKSNSSLEPCELNSTKCSAIAGDLKSWQHTLRRTLKAGLQGHQALLRLLPRLPRPSHGRHPLPPSFSIQNEAGCLLQLTMVLILRNVEPSMLLQWDGVSSFSFVMPSQSLLIVQDFQLTNSWILRDAESSRSGLGKWISSPCCFPINQYKENETWVIRAYRRSDAVCYIVVLVVISCDN